MPIHLNHRLNSLSTGSDAETPGVTLRILDEGSFGLPVGTSAARPATPSSGEIRFNSTSQIIEYFNGSTWVRIESSQITQATSSDLVGIEVLISAGQYEIGLNVSSLTQKPSLSESTDYVLIFDSTIGENKRAPISAITGLIDTTRIYDAQNTTYVDVDEIANKVVIAASGNNTALFQHGSVNRFFLFDSETFSSAVTVEASGLAQDIDIVLKTKGDGSLLIRNDTSAPSVISTDPGTDLILESGQNLILQNSSTGNVLLKTSAGNDFYIFSDTKLQIFYPGDTNAFIEDYVFTTITTDNNYNSIGTINIPADSTAFLECNLVGREQASGSTKSAAFKLKAMVYNDGSGASLTTFALEIIQKGSGAASYDANITAVGTDISINVKGATGENVKWVAFAKITKVIH